MAFTKLTSFSKKPSDLPDVPSPSMTPDDIRSMWETPLDELLSNTQDTVDKLNSTTSGSSGADNIGATGWTGVANTIQALINWLKANKTDLTGDHKGTWQGFKPTQTDPGIQGQVDSNTAQLAENVQDLKLVSAPYNYQGAVFTFIDDDCTDNAWSVAKATFDQYGVKGTFAAISNNIDTSGNLSLSQLLQMQSEGHEIVCHSKTHSTSVFRDNLSSVTDDAIDTEYNDCQQYFKDNGLNGYDTIVYPYGNFGTEANRYKRLARQYYKNGVNASGSMYNDSPSDNMYLKRMNLDMSTYSLATIESKIDDAIANNGWLIFLSHSGITTTIDSNFLGSVISYIQSKSGNILPFSEANHLKGNSISVGEFTDTSNKAFIGKDGSSDFGQSGTVRNLGIVPDNGLTMDSPLSAYQSGVISVTQIRSGSANDPLTTEGGVLTTYNFGDGSNFNYQTYVSASSNKMYKRRWNDTPTDTWASWTELYTRITGTAAPTTGTWKVGDIVENTNPNTTQVKGWVCISYGTPGSWVPYGTTFIQSYGNAAAVATGGTISISGFTLVRLAPTSAVTGVLMPSGAYAGQEITLVNESAYSITFASVGTSKVADGSSDVINSNTAAKFIWDSAKLLWYRI